MRTQKESQEDMRRKFDHFAAACHQKETQINKRTLCKYININIIPDVVN